MLLFLLHFHSYQQQQKLSLQLIIIRLLLVGRRWLHRNEKKSKRKDFHLVSNCHRFFLFLFHSILCLRKCTMKEEKRTTALKQKVFYFHFICVRCNLMDSILSSSFRLFSPLFSMYQQFCWLNICLLSG